MKQKYQLYLGDSSDDEGVGYSIEVIRKNACSLKELKFLSSFLLQEVAQSILEHEQVVATYTKKKGDIVGKGSISKHLIPLKVEKFLFGKHLISKNKGQYSNDELTQFYKDNKTAIKTFKNGFIFLKDLQSVKGELVDIEAKDLDYTKAQQNYSKYFSGINLEDEMVKYFKDKKTFEEVKKLFKGSKKLNLKEQHNIALSAVGKRELKEKKSLEEIKKFLEEEFLTIYFNKLIASLKQDSVELKNFLNKALQLNSKHQQNFVNIISSYKDELFNQLTLKKKKVEEGSLNAEDLLFTKIYIDYLTLEHNKPINNVLMQLRPKKFFSEDTDTQPPEEFFANFKLDHRIIRSKIKEIGIDNYRDAPISHNIFISDLTINADTEISKGGARTDYRKLPLKGQSSAYSNLVSNELNVKSGSGKLLKLLIQKIIREQEITDKEINNVLVDNRDLEFLYKFIDLLFHCEPERNVSAFLTNAMFFELIEAEVCNVYDLPRKLPMAIKKDEDKTSGPGAVPGARYVLDLLGGKYGEKSPYLTKRQYYDFGESDESKGQELAARDTAIFLDWLVSKSILNKEDKIEYIDADGQRKETKLGEAGGRIHDFYDTLARHSTNVYAKNTLPKIIESINHYLADAISDKKSGDSDVEMQGSDEPIIIDTSSTQRDKHKAIGDKIFKAFHSLVYEWYGIRLDWLYSFEEFKAGNREEFFSKNQDRLLDPSKVKKELINTELTKLIKQDHKKKFLEEPFFLMILKYMHVKIEDVDIQIKASKKNQYDILLSFETQLSKEQEAFLKLHGLTREETGSLFQWADNPTSTLHNLFTQKLEISLLRKRIAEQLQNQIQEIVKIAECQRTKVEESFNAWCKEKWNSQAIHTSGKSSNNESAKAKWANKSASSSQRANHNNVGEDSRESKVLKYWQDKYKHNKDDTSIKDFLAASAEYKDPVIDILEGKVKIEDTATSVKGFIIQYLDKVSRIDISRYLADKFLSNSNSVELRELLLNKIVEHTGSVDNLKFRPKTEHQDATEFLEPLYSNTFGTYKVKVDISCKNLSDVNLYKQKSPTEENATAIIQLEINNKNKFSELFASLNQEEDMIDNDKVEFEKIDNNTNVKIDAVKTTRTIIPDYRREICFSLKRFGNNLAKINNSIEFDQIKVNNQDYEITAFIRHTGDLKSGHYIAYVKENDGKWYSYNDAQRDEVDNNTLNKAKEEAYVVKYSLKDDLSLLPNKQEGIENDTGARCWLNSSVIFTKSFATLKENLTQFIQENANISQDPELLKCINPQKPLNIQESFSGGDIKMKDEYKGISDSKEGLSLESIKFNLAAIIISNLNNMDFYIAPNLISEEELILKFNNWKMTTSSHYGALIGVENELGNKHAILLHASRIKGNLIKITLTDPLAEQDSVFKAEIKKLAHSLQQEEVNAEIIYSGRQDKDYGTCADISLIMLQELIEQTANTYSIKSGQVIDDNLNIPLMTLSSAYNDVIHNFDYDKCC
jgi:hypothetical protein